MPDAASLIEALQDIVADIETMGDASGRLSPVERDQLRRRLDALWARRGEFAMDDVGIALFERARRIVEGARDS